MSDKQIKSTESTSRSDNRIFTNTISRNELGTTSSNTESKDSETHGNYNDRNHFKSSTENINSEVLFPPTPRFLTVENMINLIPPFSLPQSVYDFGFRVNGREEK